MDKKDLVDGLRKAFNTKDASDVENRMAQENSGEPDERIQRMTEEEVFARLLKERR